ncbi:MAG: efflux RND transporter permease subunit [Hyphomicrobiaceae bacterium]|nr:efflux RND transporter permease subunit [Hyphomicrobiaceae bacterium]
MSDTAHPQHPAGENGARPNGQGRRLGIAGRVAAAFVESPLTPLLLIAFFLIGMLGMLVTPREEDPQISVPMIDVFVAFPGASSSEIANLVSEPLERLMSEISGVKHVYSQSRPGMSMVTVRFDVGQQMEPSLVKVYDKLYSHLDLIPRGVSQPLVKPKSIDDVPVLTVTFSSDELDGAELRKLGLDATQRFKALDNTGQAFVVGGSAEQVRVELDPSQLANQGLTLSQVSQAIAAANTRQPTGYLVEGNRWFDIFTGDFLQNAAQVGDLVVAVRDGRPIFLRDIASVTQGVSETKSIVTNTERNTDGEFATKPAVTVAVAKKRGTNGVDVAESLVHELEAMRGTVIPPNVDITISRDYGDTAREKVSELIFKLFVVSALVTVLALVTMGIRPALIVLVTIPAVLLMSLAVAYVLGFTINRVSMFALVFAIGILVDDAIVVVENIYRRWLEAKRTDDDLIVHAVDEVGNPTILATLTVVAALLPMGFVSDMMGPYMLPIPVLASAAMVFSLAAAFIFVPWLAARVKPSMSVIERSAEREHKQSVAIARWYSHIINPIVDSRIVGYATLAVIIVALIASMAMFFVKAVPFKMLPFDNKSELQVVIDMPEGTDLFVTENLARKLGAQLQSIEEVTAFQSYVGTASPFNFNGLVRHYFLRSFPWQGDIAVQLLDKSERARSSHDIAVEVRSLLTPIAEAEGARLTIAEAPPGPPVLASMVVELYGPTADVRREVATKIMGILEKTPDVADVNTYMEAPHDELQFEIDQQRASMFGVSVGDINREIAMATGGYEVGALKSDHNLEQTTIVLQAPLATRVNLGNLLVLPIRSASGTMVPLGELGQFVNRPVDPPIYHKDLRPLEYVTGDVVGRLGAPLYGMLAVDGALQNYVTPDGVTMRGNYFARPAETNHSAFKWDGEWEVTYVTFRDMGIAFMAALVLIYILVVAEFRGFLLPLVVMAPIPLTLIGIVPGHWLLGADFTATSMIGFIALAGIIVRNSILLVEFARARVHEGLDVPSAILMAGRVRLRPILITALALIIGSMVLLSDPIFQGMAVSLLFGSLVSTFLTLVVIPLGCISVRKVFLASAKKESGEGPDEDPGPNGGPAPQGPTPGSGSGGNGPLSGNPQTVSARPARLVRKGDEQAAPVSQITPESASVPPPVSGRPPRLTKKSDSDDVPQVSETLVEDAPAPAPVVGRPARLLKRGEETAAPDVSPLAADGSDATPIEALPQPSARPPRLLKKGEQAAEAVAEAPSAEPETPAQPLASGRPARLVHRSDRAEADESAAEQLAETPPAEATRKVRPARSRPQRRASSPSRRKSSAATKRRAPAAAPRARQTAPVVDDSNAEALRIRAEGLEAALRQIAAATQRASAELATLNADIAQTQPGTTTNEEEDQ